jgi:hypothetical protein
VFVHVGRIPCHCCFGRGAGSPARGRNRERVQRR